MSKVIQSVSKRYPGTITLSYPLTFPQYAEWRRCLDTLPEAPEDPADADNSPGWRIFDLASDPDKAMLMLPAVFAVVEEWHLENMPDPLTAETFPATPPKATFRLLLGILVEINNMISEEDESPFEPPAQPIDTPMAVEPALQT